MISCYRQVVPLAPPTAQAAFASLQFHRPTRTAVQDEQAIDFACLCTVALALVPTQAMPIAGMLFALWRVESKMLVPQKLVGVRVAVPVAMLRSSLFFREMFLFVHFFRFDCNAARHM